MSSDAKKLHEALDQQLTTRRKFLLAGVVTAGGLSKLANAIGGDDTLGTLIAGSAQLSQVFRIDGTDMWVGPKSMRSTITPSKGHYFIASDAQTEFYGDGNNWVELGIGTASDPAPPSYFEELSAEKLVDVYDYIVSTDDDLNDIVNNQLSAGESIWLGLGTHTVTKSGLQALLISVDNVAIHGPGMGLATIKLEDNASTDAGSANDEAVLMLGASGGNAPSGIELKGFSIDGNDTNQSTANNERIHGVKPHGASDVTIDGLEIFDCTGGGFWRGADDSGSGYQAKNVYIHDVYNDGWLLSADDVQVADLKVENTANQDGVEPLGKNHTYSGCIVRNVAGSAFDLFGCDNVTVENSIAINGANGPATAFKFGGESGDTTTNCEFVGCIYIGSNDSGQADFGYQYQDPHKGCVVSDCISYQQGGVQQATTDGETYDGLRIIEPQGTGFQVGNAADVTVDVKIVDAQGIAFTTASNSASASGTVVVDTTNGADGVQLSGSEHKFDIYVKNAGDGGSGNDGILVDGDNITLENPYVENSDRLGIFLNNADNIRILNPHTKGNGNWAIRVNGSGTESDVLIHEPIIDGDSFGLDINAGVSDVNIVDPTYRNLASNQLSDNGTRTRIDGVIGGGRLDGADLSSISGQVQGEKAISDGTGSFIEDYEYVWDNGDSEWIGPRVSTATLNFGSIADGATAELTISVAGADTGDAVSLAPPAGIEAGLTWVGYVSSAGTVTVRVHNVSDGGGAIDPASATWGAKIEPVA